MCVCACVRVIHSASPSWILDPEITAPRKSQHLYHDYHYLCWRNLGIYTHSYVHVVTSRIISFIESLDEASICLRIALISFSVASLAFYLSFCFTSVHSHHILALACHSVFTHSSSLSSRSRHNRDKFLPSTLLRYLLFLNDQFTKHVTYLSLNLFTLSLIRGSGGQELKLKESKEGLGMSMFFGISRPFSLSR